MVETIHAGDIGVAKVCGEGAKTINRAIGENTKIKEGVDEETDHHRAISQGVHIRLAALRGLIDRALKSCEMKSEFGRL